MEVCNVYKLLEDLVAEGETICRGTENKRRKGGGIKRKPLNRTGGPNKKRPNMTSSTVVQFDEEDPFLNKCGEYIMDKLSELDPAYELQGERKRQKRQINLRSIFRVIRALSTGQFNSFREIFEVFGISGDFLISKFYSFDSQNIAN